MKSLSLSDGLAGAEGGRRATGAPATGANGSVPDSAVSEKAKRRRFTAEYKLHILREVDRTGAGKRPAEATLTACGGDAGDPKKASELLGIPLSHLDEDDSG